MIIYTDPSGRRWLALALLCTAQFMVVLDVSIVNIALAAVQEDLGFSPENLQWIISGYALTFGGFLMLAGRAADLFGRRRFLRLGLALFTLASFVGGLAQTQAVLIGARVFQGLGAALVSPAALSLLTTLFPEGEERNRALGIWGAVAAAGAAAGLLLGGALTDQLGWEWVFFINVPVGAAAVLFAPSVLAESRDPGAVSRLDIPGAVTITGGLGVLVYALTQAERAGLASPRTLGLLALALGLLTVFVIVERRSIAPLVPLRIFRLRALTGANMVTLMLAAVIGAHGFFTSLYMQQVLGYSPLATGLAFLPLTLVVMVTANLAARVVGRTGPRHLLVIGLSMVGVGMLLLIRLPVQGTYVRDLLPNFLFVAVGLGVTIVAATVAATSGIPNAEQGVASGLINTSQQLGNALGLAILVSLAAARTAAVPDSGTFDALVTGFRWGSTAAAGFAFLGVLIALIVVRDPADTPTVVLDDPLSSRRPVNPSQV